MAPPKPLRYQIEAARQIIRIRESLGRPVSEKIRKLAALPKPRKNK